MARLTKYWLFKVAQNGAAMLIVQGFAYYSGAPFGWLLACAFVYYAWQTLNDQVAKYIQESK